MTPNPDLPPGTWITYRMAGRVEFVQITKGRTPDETLYLFGPPPPVGTKVVRVIHKGDLPQRRENLIYQGVRYDGGYPTFLFTKDRS